MPFFQGPVKKALAQKLYRILTEIPLSRVTCLFFDLRLFNCNLRGNETVPCLSNGGQISVLLFYQLQGVESKVMHDTLQILFFIWSI